MEKIKQEHVLGKPTKCNTINNKFLTYGCLFERVTAKWLTIKRFIPYGLAFILILKSI
jgi:hypothetical protein